MLQVFDDLNKNNEMLFSDPSPAPVPVCSGVSVLSSVVVGGGGGPQ